MTAYFTKQAKAHVRPSTCMCVAEKPRGVAHDSATVLPTAQACHGELAPLLCLPADMPACLDVTHVHNKYATWAKKLTGIQKWFLQLDMPASVPHCS